MTAMFATGPFGFGLVLQAGEDLPVSLRGLVQLPGVLLPGSLLAGVYSHSDCGGCVRCPGRGRRWRPGCGRPRRRLPRPGRGCPSTHPAPGQYLSASIPGVVVQGVAEHRAEGPPLQPDQRVGEGGVPGCDLPGQPPAEGGAGGAQGLLGCLAFLLVAAGVFRRAIRRRGSRAAPGGSGTCRRRSATAARPGPRPPAPPSTPPGWSRRTGPAPPRRRRRPPGRPRRRCR